MRTAIAGALAALGLALAGPAAAGEFPVSSTGDIWFHADQAGFLNDDATVREEYYLRILNRELHWKEEGGRLLARLFVQLKFRDAEDHDLGEASRRFEVSAADRGEAESADRAQVLLVAEPLDPRTRSVEIRVEDMGARKRGLLYLVTGQRQGSTVRADLRPPPCLGQELGVSDLEFAWDVGEVARDSTFAKGSLDVIPNPGRTYGLHQALLTAYYEVYDRRGSEGGARTYLLREEIVSPAGVSLRTVTDTVEASGRWPRVVRFDLLGLEHGPYTLRATVRDTLTGDESATARDWSLIWKDESWAMSEQDMLDAARVLFEEDEADRFRAMSAGDRELYLQEFWLKMDPTPTTPGNERLEEFRRRVGFANQEFSAHGKKGMITDRGRVYIRFGAADEVERELLPTKDTQLDNKVEELEKENPTAQTLKTEDQFDLRPYEIWTYTRQGEPLFPEREQTTPVTGLRFVFVDETGTGNYVLRYTSDFLGY